MHDTSIRYVVEEDQHRRIFKKKMYMNLEEECDAHFTKFTE